MRLFLASFATIPDYPYLQKKFETALEGKWVERENLHRTLWFFGEREDPAPIIEKLRQIHFPHRRGIIEGLGIMGRKGRKMLYAKLRQDPFQKSVQALSSTFGAPNHPPKAHITLLRIKHRNGNDYRKIIHAYRHKEIGFTHNQVALVESKTTEKGPIYTPIAYF